MSKPTKDQIDAWFDESRAAGKIPYRSLDALDLCRVGGVLEQFADAFCAAGKAPAEPASDSLEKKVRGVLSRVFRDLPVFGGPLGWEIEARLLDEATPEIVALLEGGKTSSHVLPSPEDITVEWFGGDEASPVVRTSARSFVEPALRVRALFEKCLGIAASKDEPVEDLAERARLVARELRSRGIWSAQMEGSVVYVPTMNRIDGIWTRYVERHDMRVRDESTRSIADEIQRKEAHRARKWAGDDE